MIAICPNPYRDTELELTLKLRSLLEENGFTVGVFPVFSDPVEPAIPEGIETRDISYLPRNTTLVIIVGGDGTTLAVARNLKYKDLPLLCVNLGTKGFMASLEPEDSELNDKIIRAARGEEKLSRRMCIDIDLIRDGKIIYSDSVNAINWVRHKECRTKLALTPQTVELWNMIRRAEAWLQNNTYTTEIRKWDTDHWGEIPADFGRK